eukprot:TRINITY_DN8181_c0_g1_i1.p2 TRINITY_DN8181_c0_g1~~TRINITY_DN8181_c0_g1_i1.p2  ORF type:complete len:267 (+),score=82.83 TRINITY_DN8181_c0_g1_i1:73-801(+)
MPQEAPAQPPQQQGRKSKGQRIGSLIHKAGGAVVSGIEYATPKVQQGIHAGKEKAIERATPNEKPAEVNPENYKKAREHSATAAKVTGKVADKFLGCAKSVGRSLSGGGSKRKPSTGIKAVAGAAVTEFANVVDAATSAGKTTLATTCTATEEVVGYKYGEQAQEATREGLGAVQNVAEAGLNVAHVSPGGFVKAAGKQAGKDYVGAGGSSEPPQPPRSGYTAPVAQPQHPPAYNPASVQKQ